jgi:hypothetical protein
MEVRSRSVGKAGVHLERQPDVLEQRHRPEQRPGLIHDAEAPLDLLRSSPVAVTISLLSMKMCPEIGGLSPIMCFISVPCRLRIR